MDRLWLDTLTSCPAEDLSSRRLKLRGFLIPAPAERIRLLIKGQCLDFAIADVESVREMDTGNKPLCGAILVEVTLCTGAPLLAFQDAEALQATARAGVLPFAIATRPGRVISPPCPNYAAVEKDYLRRHGIARE
jgi:hypothetical protein